MLPTVTGVGHATIGTGSDPLFHGITVNNLFNRATGKPQPAYANLDPQELMALTLGDSWNLATNGAAVIIGQGGAIRATAGLVGRGSCLVGAKKVMAASYGGSDGGCGFPRGGVLRPCEADSECALPDADERAALRNACTLRDDARR